eukprot:TRINITY_DN35332_c0_g1_i1.p1 TRINITY_DN35332_c0_g1~~TRINITY_DN35332_c0_g1_i1.p1  ORF type:complete len:367 (-),score=50.41 TRINITY_DN35332_c0_g1_i1:60-1160(-)
MPLYVLPLIKCASLTGCALGVSDTLYQYLKKRKAVKALEPPNRVWNADRTAKVAIGGLVAGPLIGAPFIWVQHLGLPQLFDVLGSVVVSELIVSPLIFFAGTGRTRYFKPYIPLTLLGTGIGGVTAAAIISTSLLHEKPFADLSLYGVYSPEAIVFTAGLASAAFIYYCYSHQYAINYRSEVPYQRRLINAGAWVGAISAAGLLTMGIVDTSSFHLAHKIAADTFIIGGSIHQLSLTYQTALVSRERPLSARENAVYKLRKYINVANVASLGAAWLFPLVVSAPALPIIFEYSALSTWALYVLTSYDDFILMPPDGSDTAIFESYEKTKAEAELQEELAKADDGAKDGEPRAFAQPEPEVEPEETA